MIKKWMALVGFFLLITNVGFAVTFTRDGGDSSWSNLGEWNNNSSGSYSNSAVFPTINDTIVLNAGRVLSVDTNAFVGLFKLPNASSAFLELGTAGTTLTVNTLNIGVKTAAGEGTVTHSAGVLDAGDLYLMPSKTDFALYQLSGGEVIADDLDIGVDASTATGTAWFVQSGGTVTSPSITVGGAGAGIYDFQGGNLSTIWTMNENGTFVFNGGTFAKDMSGVNLTFGQDGLMEMVSGGLQLMNGAATDVITLKNDLHVFGGDIDLEGQVRNYNEVKVAGDKATIDLDYLGSFAGCSYVFELSDTGISPINVGNWAGLANATLAVDGSSFVDGAATHVLFDAGTLQSMPAASDITITGLADARVDQVGHTVVLTIDESKELHAFENTVGDGLWGTAGNWSDSVVPAGTVHAIVSDGLSPVVAADAPEILVLSVGDAGVAGTSLEVAADLTVSTLNVASAVNSSGAVVQSNGTVTVLDRFKVASEGAGADGSYTSSGGRLIFPDIDFIVGAAGTGRWIVDGKGPEEISGGNLTVGSQATLEFDLDMLGITPIVLSGTATLDPACQIIVDGSIYEGLDGYVSLINAETMVGSLSASQVTVIGMDDREPTVVVDSSGLWLRVTAPLSMSDALSTMVPANSATIDYAHTSFSATRALESTESLWGTTFHEAVVMDTTIGQAVTDGASDSWEMTIGRGGQIASFRTESLGETVPPQSDGSPWMDEVWQGVAIDSELNMSINDAPYFIHQAGVYQEKDPELTETFYSPQVAACMDEANRNFMSVHWGQQAHLQIFTNDDTADDWHSDLLYFTNIRDLGQGVIEVSLGFYNYGPDLPNYFNMPWGGVRRTATEYAFLSDASGSGWSDAQTGMFGDGTIVTYSGTGGTIAYSATTDGTTPCLGLVFGKDPDPMLPKQLGASRLRYGYAGGTPTGNEDDWRNYYVSAGIRRYDLSQGSGVWGRYYFVLGDDLDDLEQRIADRNVATEPTLIEFDYSEASTPLVGYRFRGTGGDFRIAEEKDDPDFYLYAYPVDGSFPLYEIIEDDETRHITWNPYGTGVIKTYDGTIGSIRLLGFAVRTADTNSEGTSYIYTSTDILLSGLGIDYVPSAESLSVRLPFDSLIAHWTLDDESGAVAYDETGHGFDGVVADALWTANGLQGSALSFTGGTQRLEIPVEVFASISQEISISMWVDGDENQPSQDSVIYAVNSSNQRMLNVHLPWSNSSVFWDAGNSTGYDRIDKSADSSQFKGGWNHWVFTKNAITGTMNIYHNGEPWMSGFSKARLIGDITYAVLGGQTSGSGYQGRMDEVQIYNLELGAQEVSNLFEEYRMKGIPVRWLSDYGLQITDTVGSDDPDGDDRSTFDEYAFGGVPTNAASSGYPMTADLLQENGTNWFEVVHARRRNSEGDLSYVLETSSNLLSNDWKTADTTPLTTTGALDADYEAVTNRIDTTGKTNEFIRLRIEQK